MRDLGFAAAILLLCALFVWLVGAWFIRWINREKYIWRFVRYGGGGNLESPIPMTEKEAIKFIADNNCEVGHVDRIRAFIFYKPKGG
jgi:hypothetical protein